MVKQIVSCRRTSQSLSTRVMNVAIGCSMRKGVRLVSLHVASLLPNAVNLPLAVLYETPNQPMADSSLGQLLCRKWRIQA